VQLVCRTEEESRLGNKLQDELDFVDQIQRLEVRYERDLLDRFSIFVVVSLGSKFSFELKDHVRRNVRKIVQSVQPTAQLFVRFI
jgi:hypothetical protein